jgi:hypothetical protein
MERGVLPIGWKMASPDKLGMTEPLWMTAVSGPMVIAFSQ